LTGQLSDESLGKCTVEESAVANVVIEGDTSEIDDLKEEIKVKFSRDQKSSNPWTHFGLSYHLLALITNVEMNCLTTECAVLHASRYYDTSLHGTRYNAPERVTKFLPSN
jgi:hypothetical protein